MLAVTLTVDEKIAAAHGDVRVPRSTIRGVRVEPDALAAVSGLRTHPALPIISTEHAEQIAEQIRTGAAHAAQLPRTVLEGFPGHATVAARFDGDADGQILAPLHSPPQRSDHEPRKEHALDVAEYTLGGPLFFVVAGATAAVMAVGLAIITVIDRVLH